jgi:hypothetical protein
MPRAPNNRRGEQKYNRVAYEARQFAVLIERGEVTPDQQDAFAAVLADVFRTRDYFRLKMPSDPNGHRFLPDVNSMEIRPSDVVGMSPQPEPAPEGQVVRLFLRHREVPGGVSRPEVKCISIPGTTTFRVPNPIPCGEFDAYYCVGQPDADPHPTHKCTHSVRVSAPLVMARVERRADVRPPPPPPADRRGNQRAAPQQQHQGEVSSCSTTGGGGG